MYIPQPPRKVVTNICNAWLCHRSTCNSQGHADDLNIRYNALQDKNAALERTIAENKELCSKTIEDAIIKSANSVPESIGDIAKSCKSEAQKYMAGDGGFERTPKEITAYARRWEDAGKILEPCSEQLKSLEELELY